MHTSLSAAAAVLGFVVCSVSAAQTIPLPEESLFTLPSGVQTHWASAENPTAAKGAGGQAKGGRKGSAFFPLKPGEKKVLAEVQGKSGMIRHIWMTIQDRSPLMLRGLRLDIYWDGAEKPAVSAPLGDFFCHGLGRITVLNSALFSSPEGRSFNCFIPMPFRTGMRVELTNEADVEQPAVFYTVAYTTGDKIKPDALYFHAYFHRQNPTQLQQDYEMLPKVEGRGRYLGVNVGVKVHDSRYFRTWWGEGEVKIYLDGDEAYPSLCGTGTEDYVGTAWGQGEYNHAYMGSPISDNEAHEYCFYRMHVPDPVYFEQDVRVTIQQIGCWGPDSKIDLAESDRPVYATGPGLVPIDFSPEGGTGEWGLFEREDDYSSCAYFYLDRSASNLPPLAPLSERLVQSDEEAAAAAP